MWAGSFCHFLYLNTSKNVYDKEDETSREDFELDPKKVGPEATNHHADSSGDTGVLTPKQTMTTSHRMSTIHRRVGQPPLTAI